jgi:hypothetical protein
MNAFSNELLERNEGRSPQGDVRRLIVLPGSPPYGPAVGIHIGKPSNPEELCFLGSPGDMYKRSVVPRELRQRKQAAARDDLQVKRPCSVPILVHCLIVLA